MLKLISSNKSFSSISVLSLIFQASLKEWSRSFNVLIFVRLQVTESGSAFMVVDLLHDRVTIAVSQQIYVPVFLDFISNKFVEICFQVFHLKAIFVFSRRMVIAFKDVVASIELIESPLGLIVQDLFNSLNSVLSSNDAYNIKAVLETFYRLFNELVFFIVKQLCQTTNLAKDTAQKHLQFAIPSFLEFESFEVLFQLINVFLLEFAIHPVIGEF